MIHVKDIFVSDVTVNGKGKQNVGEISLMKNHDMYFRYEVVYIISNLHIFLNRFVDNYLSFSLCGKVCDLVANKTRKAVVDLRA